MITDRLTERKWKSNEVELKPCPFCGSTRIKKEERSNRVKVVCSDCGVATPEVTLVTVAIGIWNKRV